MTKSIIDEVVAATGKEYDEVTETIDSFLEQLHKKVYEYKGLNGDYIGERLPHELSNKSYYHLLGFLNDFDERYSWDQSAYEYLWRLGAEETWSPFEVQMEQWEKPENKE